MATRLSSIRIAEETRREIEEICRRTGRDFSAVVNEILTEAIKMRRIPGIVFADGVTRRVPRIAGTGIEVFEIVRDYRAMDNNWESLKEAYHWLSEQQLLAALAYAKAFPEEIEERLRDEERWQPGVVWSRYPFTRPERS